MNWYNKISECTLFDLVKYANSIIAYHATKEKFDRFDLKYSTDDFGNVHGGLGRGKFYFALDKKHAHPKINAEEPITGYNVRPTRILTVSLDIKKSYNGKLYRERVGALAARIGWRRACSIVDEALKREGYDAIHDGWQIAVFDPGNVKIL